MAHFGGEAGEDQAGQGEAGGALSVSGCAVLPCAVLCYCLTQVHAAFSERRKLLRNNLMSLYGAKQVGRS